MHNATEDDKTVEILEKAKDFQDLFNQLNFLPGNEGSLSLAIKKQIKEEHDTDDISNKIDESIAEIITNYDNLGVSQSGISELDPYQANEICANATSLIEKFISFLKDIDFSLQNDVIKKLEHEKNTYNKMHHVVYSLISNLESNENIIKENESNIESKLNTTQEINHNFQENDLDTLLKDPFIKEELEIYDLDSELVDISLWNEAVIEIHKTLDNSQSIISLDNLDDLLDHIEQDSKVLDSEKLHTTVSNDIKEAKSSIRAELEEKYKTILYSAIQLNKGEIDDFLASRLLESKTNISQMYHSLNSLGEEEQAMLKLDEDKFKFAMDFCKLLHSQIILKQYQQFMNDSSILDNSLTISNEERFNISKLHGNLVNNIQEFYINWGSSNAMQELWDSCDKKMTEINHKYEQEIISQKKEREATKDASFNNIDINSLIAKANKAINNKDYTALNELKKQLLEHQTYLSKSLEKSIHSIETIQPLRVAISSVSDSLKKINIELGITTPISLSKPTKNEGVVENTPPTSPSGRMTR